MIEQNKDKFSNITDTTFKSFIYSGKSMHPTFKPGQLLYVRPSLENISVGDVIIFYDPVRKVRVVHRVVKFEDYRIFTRGDNNSHDDHYPVQLQNILGIVRWVGHNGSMTPVQGGHAGIKRLERQATKNKITQFFLRLFFPFYKVVKSSEIISKFWHPQVKKIKFMTENGYIIKYVHRNRTVATWVPKNKRFTYRHPYDLVLKPPQDSPQ